MAKKKNTIPSGFNDILGNIYSNAESMEEVTNIDDIAGPNVPLVEDEEDKQPPVKEPEDGNKTDDAVDVHEDNSQIPTDILDNKNTVEDNQEDEHIED